MTLKAEIPALYLMPQRGSVATFRLNTFETLPASFSIQVSICSQLQKGFRGKSIQEDFPGKGLRKCFATLKQPSPLSDNKMARAQRERNWCKVMRKWLVACLRLPSLPRLGREMKGWRNATSNPGAGKRLTCRLNLVTACFHK